MSSPDFSSSGSSSSSSDRSYDNERYRRVCAYQTRRFHGQECGRYFDCPTHTIERAGWNRPTPEDEEEDEEDGDEDLEDEDEDDEDSGDEDDASEEHGDTPEVLGASYLGRDGPAAQDRESASAGKQRQEVIDLTSSPPRGEQDGPDAAGPSNSTRMGAPRVLDVIDLTGDSNGTSPPPESVPADRAERAEPERTLPDIPASAAAAAASGESSSSRDGAVSPSAHRRPATPPSPPPPTRRRTSTNQSGTALSSGRQPQQQPQRPSVSRRPSDIVLPRWQPDAEVTFCPICRTQFSFLVRKHHCRKCGRVVCSSCSPHRITIPYQYIVVAPGTPRPGLQRYPSSLIGGEGGYADFSSLGGGERVRLCNPCVPDPNTNPPHSQQSPGLGRGHGRSQSTVGAAASAYGSPMDAPVSDAYLRNRSATMLPNPFRNRPYQPTQNRILSGTPPSHYPYGVPSSSGSYRAHRHRSVLDVGPGSPSSSTAAHGRPLPPDPPQLAEEDECPVCHRELPPRNLPNFEALREAHISVCITSHSTYGGMSTGEGSSSQPRRTGMFPYLATEKDCVDSAECTICLEEFEVGVPMARLECLCRFHRDCIARWFAKNPGRCPVHSHDGHGF